MPAILKFDQAGKPAGNNNESRDDIVAGIAVEITNVSPGVSQNDIELHWKSPDDDTGTITGASPTWLFTPKAGTWGKARVKLIVDGEEIVHTFTVLSPILELEDLAANERADDDASLQDMGPDKIALSETNQPFKFFASGSAFGWYRAWRRLLEKLEALFNPTTGHTHDGTGANGPLVESLGDVSLLKIDDYQASFFETVRCHPGFGGGDSFVVTLPPTNGMADRGKWCRLNIEDTTNSKFVTVVGFGGPNAATIKKLGKKKIAYYKKVFQKYKKLKYFGDLINENSALESADLNMGNAFRLYTIEQDALLIWDGVQSWWIVETHGFGPIRGNEAFNPDQDDHFVDIHNKGIVGQNPPTRQVDPASGLFGAELFGVNNQIFISVPIKQYWRGDVFEPDPQITLHLLMIGQIAGGTVQFEIKAKGLRRTGSSITATPYTQLRSVSVSNSFSASLNFFDIQTALDDVGSDLSRYILMRIKCTSVGATGGVNLLDAFIEYKPIFSEAFLFANNPKYD